MNYEKLHKDTINKLQQMVNSGKITVETACGICADFVPENEDEVMIKFIKNQLFNIKKTITENYELDAKLTKAIDWLEKQCEQKSVDDLTQQEAMDIAVAKCFNEQKPTDKVEPKFNVGDIISNGISEVKIVSIDKNNYNVTNGEIENDAHAGNWVVYFKDQDNWKLKEQNSVWGEEDESEIDILCHFLEEYGERYYGYIPLQNTISWLKSLKDRVQPQPKKEWSEQEQVRINRIVACLENLNVADNDILLKDVAWLKSLKNRYTCRPSEE